MVLAVLVADSLLPVVLSPLAPGLDVLLHPKYNHRRRRWQCSVDCWPVLNTSRRSF
jgi:hypothetical protein